MAFHSMSSGNPPTYTDATGVPTNPQPAYNPYDPPPGAAPPPVTAPPAGSAPPGVQMGSVHPQVVYTTGKYNSLSSWTPQISAVTNSDGCTVLLGTNSTVVTCPSCHQQISSEVKSVPTTKTHSFALVLCMFGCWPCCLIPYCVDNCQARSHSCPNCGAFLGVHEL